MADLMVGFVQHGDHSGRGVHEGWSRPKFTNAFGICEFTVPVGICEYTPSRFVHVDFGFTNAFGICEYVCPPIIGFTNAFGICEFTVPVGICEFILPSMPLLGIGFMVRADHKSLP